MQESIEGRFIMYKSSLILVLGLAVLLGCTRKEDFGDELIELYATYYSFENIPKFDPNKTVSVYEYIERHEEIRELLYENGYFRKRRVAVSLIQPNFDRRVFFLDMLQIAPLHELYPSIEFEKDETIIQVFYVPRVEDEIHEYFQSHLITPSENVQD